MNEKDRKQQVTRRKYSPEFKDRAVTQAEKDGVS